MTLTREAITSSIFDRLGLSKTASARAVGATFEIIKKTLEGGEDVLISGFWKFCIKEKGKGRERKGRTLKQARTWCWPRGGSTPSNFPRY